MTFICPYIGNVIIPIDGLIFFRGVETTNQINILKMLKALKMLKILKIWKVLKILKVDIDQRR